MVLTANMCLFDNHSLLVMSVLSFKLRLRSVNQWSSKLPRALVFVSEVSYCSKSISSSQPVNGDLSGMQILTRFLFPGEGLKSSFLRLSRFHFEPFESTALFPMLV